MSLWPTTDVSDVCTVSSKDSGRSKTALALEPLDEGISLTCGPLAHTFGCATLAEMRLKDLTRYCLRSRFLSPTLLALTRSRCPWTATRFFGSGGGGRGVIAMIVPPIALPLLFLTDRVTVSLRGFEPTARAGPLLGPSYL